MRGLAATCAAMAFANATFAIDYDESVTPDTIFGDGNANGSFTVDRQASVELGMRGKQRYPPMNIFNSNGDGTYTFSTGTGGGPVGNSEWSFEWSVNTDYDDSSGLVVGDLTYEIGMDNDPGPGTDYLVFDPVSIGTVIPYTVPVGPIPAWDHAMGDNTTPNGEGEDTLDGPTYAGYLATYNVAQNSWRPIFYQNAAPYSWDPDVPGRYEYYLAAFDDGTEVARTAITIVAVDGATLSLEADPCQTDQDLGEAGLQVEVELWLRNPDGAAVTGYQAFLSYDDSAMTYEGALSSYEATPFIAHIQSIATADVAADELRLDGNTGSPVGTTDDELLATLVFTVAECDPSAVSFDLDEGFDSEVSFNGSPILTDLLDSGSFVADATAPSITCPADITVAADAGVGDGCESALLNFIEPFDDAVSTCATQTPDCFYVDRYPPAVFETTVFDGDNRLSHGVNVADSAANRPPAFSSSFYDTQGRKYDIDMPVGATLGVDLWVPADAAANDRRADLWATTFDGNNDVSGFPIVGFSSADDLLTGPVDGPRFRVFVQDTDQDDSNGLQPGWINLFNVTDFDRWYRFEMRLTATAYEFRVTDLTTTTVVASYNDTTTFGSIRIGNLILQVFNFGTTYTMYWDNLTLGPKGPFVTDNCDLSPVVTFERSDNPAFGFDDPFPTGTTTITWTATDACGNVADCTSDVIVTETNVVSLDVELVGTTTTGSRCIHFVTNDCGVTEDIPLAFVGGVFSGEIQIPCGIYTSLCAKDEQHTKWDTVGLSLSLDGTTWVAADTVELDAGDTDNDGDVDINDVTLFLSQIGDSALSGGCPWDGTTRDADFSNNGSVFTEDYSLLTPNWLTVSSCACTLAFDGGPVVHNGRSSITVGELEPLVAERADLNRDRVVDYKDVAIFEQMHGLAPTLSSAMKGSRNAGITTGR